jgi:hypothetical protein
MVTVALSAMVAMLDETVDQVNPGTIMGPGLGTVIKADFRAVVGADLGTVIKADSEAVIRADMGTVIKADSEAVIRADMGTVIRAASVTEEIKTAAEG